MSKFLRKYSYDVDLESKIYNNLTGANTPDKLAESQFQAMLNMSQSSIPGRIKSAVLNRMSVNGDTPVKAIKYILSTLKTLTTEEKKYINWFLKEINTPEKEYNTIFWFATTSKLQAAAFSGILNSFSDSQVLADEKQAFKPYIGGGTFLDFYKKLVKAKMITRHYGYDPRDPMQQAGQSAYKTILPLAMATVLNTTVIGKWVKDNKKEKDLEWVLNEMVGLGIINPKNWNPEYMGMYALTFIPIFKNLGWILRWLAKSGSQITEHAVLAIGKSKGLIAQNVTKIINASEKALIKMWAEAQSAMQSLLKKLETITPKLEARFNVPRNAGGIGPKRKPKVNNTLEDPRVPPKIPAGPKPSPPASKIPSQTGTNLTNYILDNPDEVVRSKIINQEQLSTYLETMAKDIKGEEIKYEFDNLSSKNGDLYNKVKLTQAIKVVKSQYPSDYSRLTTGKFIEKYWDKVKNEFERLGKLPRFYKENKLGADKIYSLIPFDEFRSQIRLGGHPGFKPGALRMPKSFLDSRIFTPSALNWVLKTNPVWGIVRRWINKHVPPDTYALIEKEYNDFYRAARKLKMSSVGDMSKISLSNYGFTKMGVEILYGLVAAYYYNKIVGIDNTMGVITQAIDHIKSGKPIEEFNSTTKLDESQKYMAEFLKEFRSQCCGNKQTSIPGSSKFGINCQAHAKQIASIATFTGQDGNELDSSQIINTLGISEGELACKVTGKILDNPASLVNKNMLIILAAQINPPNKPKPVSEFSGGITNSKLQFSEDELGVKPMGINLENLGIKPYNLDGLSGPVNSGRQRTSPSTQPRQPRTPVPQNRSNKPQTQSKPTSGSGIKWPKIDRPPGF